jgi:hypothetical protein
MHGIPALHPSAVRGAPRKDGLDDLVSSLEALIGEVAEVVTCSGKICTRVHPLQKVSKVLPGAFAMKYDPWQRMI